MNILRISILLIMLFVQACAITSKNNANVTVICEKGSTAYLMKFESNRILRLLDSEDSIIESNTITDLGTICKKELRMIRYTNITVGTYAVCLMTHFEDWASHCEFYTNVALTSGDNVVMLSNPKGQIHCSVIFEKTCPCPEFKDAVSVPLRVEKITNNRIDPIYRQWLRVSKTPPHIGWLSYIEPGLYRITAFETPFYSRSTTNQDVGAAIVNLTQDILTDGQIEIKILPLTRAAKVQARLPD